MVYLYTVLIIPITFIIINHLFQKSINNFKKYIIYLKGKMKGYGERFKKIRQALNFSQSEFGQKLGLSSQGVSNIEKEKSFLSLNSLEKLLEFNVNLNYLVGSIGEIFNEPYIDDCFKDKVRQVLKEEGILK